MYIRRLTYTSGAFKPTSFGIPILLSKIFNIWKLQETLKTCNTNGDVMQRVAHMKRKMAGQAGWVSCLASDVTALLPFRV